MDNFVNLLSQLKTLNPGTRYFINRLFNPGKFGFMEEAIELLKKINDLEPAVGKLSPGEMKEKTAGLRQRLADGEALDDILPEAFALVREASNRSLQMRHFDVQILGGICLHRGKVAEMTTGEGKTLVATLALYLNALAGKGCHLVTVNDYLAKRDTQWMGAIYHTLGLSTGCIVSYKESADAINPAYIFDPTYLPADSRYLYLQPARRREAYECDITYGVGSEFGFDYLRDNMAGRKEDQVQRKLHYAIIDEVDSILIDEARTPLIISGPSDESTGLYYDVDRLVKKLNKETDFSMDEEAQSIALTEEGIAKCERLLSVQNLYDGAHTELVHVIGQSLRAQAFFKRDKEYVVKDGAVVIVDEFTGRLMPGRKWSDGLHQAIEAKEGVRIESENQTLATVSFQNYFRLYGKIAGMTGTALTEAAEFQEIYHLEVIVIPTNRPLVRTLFDDEIYKADKEKLNAIVLEIERVHAEGRPILVGTVSIEKAEKLSRMLHFKNVPHQVLHGKNHETEAAIIAQAGRPRSVTIATQMAGRGVDIILGGNPDILAREETVKVIWSKKKGSQPGRTAKNLADVMNETEDRYKKALGEIEQRHRTELDRLKTDLFAKEQLFTGLDRKVRDRKERDIYRKKAGDAFRRYEAKLSQLKERSWNTEEVLAVIQREEKNRTDKIRDQRETVTRAYRDLEDFRQDLNNKYGIVSRSQVEERRKALSDFWSTSIAKWEESRREVLGHFAAIATLTKGLQESLLLIASDEVRSGREAKDLAARGKNLEKLLQDVREQVPGTASETDYRKTVNEFFNREEGALKEFLAAADACEKAILLELGEEEYRNADRDYTEGLKAYEERQAVYDKECAEARKEYEEIRGKNEEEWKSAREEMEKSPQEFRALFDELLEKYRQPWQKDHEFVVERGGLHVIGSERYESRRIDNQLKGRSGRQGDPGSSRYYLGLDDDLLRVFGSDRLMSVMQHLPEGEMIAHPLITKLITNAQKKVEARNFEIRKQLIEFDDVLNEQRKIIYELRQELMEGQGIEKHAEEMILDITDDIVGEHFDPALRHEDWKIEVLTSYLHGTFGVSPAILPPSHAGEAAAWRENVRETIAGAMRDALNAKIAVAGPFFAEIRKFIGLQSIDNRWKAHLRAIDELREGIALRAYAQKDPLIAYKHEGFKMFQEMLGHVRREMLSALLRLTIQQGDPPPVPVQTPRRETKPSAYIHQTYEQFDTVSAPEDGEGGPASVGAPPLPFSSGVPGRDPGRNPQEPFRAEKKTGRNEPCPCNSGKKYKNCCGKNR